MNTGGGGATLRTAFISWPVAFDTALAAVVTPFCSEEPIEVLVLQAATSCAVELATCLHAAIM